MKVKTITFTLVTFMVYFILDDLYFRDVRTWIDTYLNQIGISHIITYLLFGIPLFLGVLLIHNFKNFYGGLGLNKSIFKGILFAFTCTLPMFLGFAIFFDFNSEISLNGILITVVAASFFEELYYRGYLFGQLYRYTKLGYLPSVILGALVFALIHLYQSPDPLSLMGIFLVTFLGGLLFAWVYAEWNFNIWAPIFLHMFMNLAWDLFSVSDNALGGAYGNIFRVLTILLMIGLTIVYKRQKGLPLEITKKTIWMKIKNWERS